MRVSVYKPTSDDLSYLEDLRRTTSPCIQRVTVRRVPLSGGSGLFVNLVVHNL